MAEHVVLHVGTMKSGTSHLQDLLFHHQQRLRAHQVLVPGTTWRRQAIGITHVLNGRDDSRQWADLRAEVRAWPGTAVLSMERLGPAAEGKGARFLADLGARSADVVITARDLNRTLVSMWQETVQNGRTWTWADYLADVERRRPGGRRSPRGLSTPAGTFWRQQDLPGMARAWQAVPGVRRVTVVTVPRPGSSRAVLAERFGEAAGLSLAAPVDEADLPAAGNVALGLPSVLALRLLNEVLEQRGHAFPYAARTRKHVLAKTVLGPRRGHEPSLGLAPSPWLVRHQQEATRDLESSGVGLVGDWSDLEPVEVPGVRPEDVTEAEVSAALVAGLSGLVTAQARGRRRRRGAPPSRPR